MNSNRKRINLLRPTEDLVGLPRARISCALRYILSCSFDTGANVADCIAKGLSNIASDCVHCLANTTRCTANNTTNSVSHSGQCVAEN